MTINIEGFSSYPFGFPDIIHIISILLVSFTALINFKTFFYLSTFSTAHINKISYYYISFMFFIKIPSLPS